MSATGWTVVFRDGVPTDWSSAAQAIAGGSRFVLADAARAVRQGQGFVDVVMDEHEARTVEVALGRVGLVARALRWAECEPAETPQRCRTPSLAADELVPGFPFVRVEVVHLVFAQGAAFFLPPPTTELAKSVHRVASVVDTGVSILGLTDLGVANAVKNLSEASMSTASPSVSAPEWVVELFGLWTPRVHVPVEGVSVVGAQGGRARLAAFLEQLLQRVPTARRLGPIDLALKRGSLEGLRPTQSAEHRRLVSALLTARRLWPS